MVPKRLLVGDDEFRAKVEEPLKALLDQYKDPKALLIEGLKEAGLDADPSKHTFRYSYHKTAMLKLRSIQNTSRTYGRLS